MARVATRLLIVLLLTGAAPLVAQMQPAQVPIRGSAALDSLARLGFEVADVRRIGGQDYAVVIVSPTTALQLSRNGFAPSLLARAAAADTFRVFHSFDKPVSGIRATLESWAAGNTLVHLDTAGLSLEGRPIVAVKVGAASDDPARPNVLFMAAHHAREWISTAVAMRLIRWLADSGGAAVATHDIWVIPVQNPDGYQYSFDAERYWRKNRRPNAGGSVGVDLNRNYPSFWGFDEFGSSGYEYAETFRGPSAASEPETRAIMAFHAAHPPVVSLSYHSYGGLVLFPWGFRAGELAPDAPRFQALAGTDLFPAVRDSLPDSRTDRYHPGPGWNLYATNGEYTDWAYRTYGTIAFTTELTSGCCMNGGYYGFEFPDDSALVERVFRDNLPFALSLVDASGNLAAAPGVSGLVPNAPRFNILWPDAWLNLDRAAPRPQAITLRTSTGILATRGAQTDSLGQGTLRTMWRTNLRADTIRALRAEGSGVSAELLTLGGAEASDLDWTGWSRDTATFAGTHAWTTYFSDTLVSPVVDLRNRAGVWLHLWTRHRASLFVPEQRGVIQFSGDSGGSWSTVALIAGDGPNWYPLRVDLPQASGRRGARLRFISEQSFQWSIDAVGFATDSTAAFLQLAAVGNAQVSENPVRGDHVVISWPAPVTGTSRVTIYTFRGERLAEATVPAPGNEYVWDLTIGGSRRVVNGAYIVVVDVGGNRYRRRVFVARANP